MAEVSKQALVLFANRTGAVVLDDNAQWKNRIQIRSETSDSLYIVAQNKKNGTWGCSCFAWKRYRHCKHLTTMLPLLVTDQRGS